MNKLHRFCLLVTLVAFCLEGCHAQPSLQHQAIPLIASIALPGVAGRIDHLAFDSSTQRIFIADIDDIFYHQKTAAFIPVVALATLTLFNSRAPTNIRQPKNWSPVQVQEHRCLFLQLTGW